VLQNTISKRFRLTVISAFDRMLDDANTFPEIEMRYEEEHNEESIPSIIRDQNRRKLISGYCKNNSRITRDATKEEIRNRALALGIDVPKTSK
jgi:hypothetical protein